MYLWDAIYFEFNILLVMQVRFFNSCATHVLVPTGDVQAVLGVHCTRFHGTVYHNYNWQADMVGVVSLKDKTDTWE